ncbi:hypothetical protein [Rhodovibrio salinarum]|uniref:Uncharacterized protein n=1 Tax=Rhodovibrio salinarum TaxID=1087 RepID=A0A934QI87_9PROT|nr:hypothetical protein [Rhodovibrio salinarum]MBK1697263.1 hypothetical protein [Rhodovibrio salinarum]
MAPASFRSHKDWLDLDDTALAAALDRVARDGAAAVPALSRSGRHELIQAATALDFRTARPVVGEGDRAVTQCFEIADEVPAASPLGTLAAELADRLNAALARPETPSCPPIVLNDRVVQRYPATTVGISPHKDHVRYVHLVVNLVLQGAAPFYICPARSFDHALEITGQAGDALLMRAPGFAGSDHRPFHAVGAVMQERLVLGLRQDSRA